MVPARMPHESSTSDAAGATVACDSAEPSDAHAQDEYPRHSALTPALCRGEREEASPAGDRRRDVVIVGGGLAGIAAAVRLAETGVRVTLVETRKRLGGRATSFVDPTRGDLLDNCQHVLMGCCTNLIELYERLGVLDRIVWHRTLYFADAGGRIDRFEADDLPAPFHLTRALLAMRVYSWAEKAAIARGMLAILRVSPGQRRALAGVSFADWLARHRQPRVAIERFWAVIIVSACNERIDRVAASGAIQVFQDGFLRHTEAYRMGVSGVPLVDLYDRAVEHVKRAGGEVRLGTSAEALEFDGRRITGLRLTGGARLEADACVSAVPFDRLAKLASPEMVAADGRLAALDRFDVSPIIGVHLFLRRADGRAVTDLPHLVLVDSPLQWMFNKGMERTDDGAAVHHLHGVISAAYEWVSRPVDEIAAMAVRELRRVLPGMAGAALDHHRVVKEKRATFALRPGIDAVRPAPTGPIENLFLAGDWCDTGWPATMEGAVRSGYRAAAAVTETLGVCVRATGRTATLAPDLDPAPLYRLVAAG